MKQERPVIHKVNLGFNFYKDIIHPQKIELCGSTNTGTTAFSLYISKKFHDCNLTTVYIDVSRRLTKQYLLQNNSYDSLVIVPATTTEQIYDIIEKFKLSADLFILDDISGISTGNKYAYEHKRLLKNLINYLNRELINNSIIYINQVRINTINGQAYFPYGYLLEKNTSIRLRELEKRQGYRIIQGKFEKNDFGTEDYFSFKLYQNRLEGDVKC